MAGCEPQFLYGFRRQLAVKAERPLDCHLPVAEGLIWKDLRPFAFFELEERIADPRDAFLRQLTVLLAQVLAQRLEPLRGVDELDSPSALLGLAVCHHPDVGGDAGVVEHVERQGDDRLQPVSR